MNGRAARKTDTQIFRNGPTRQKGLWSLRSEARCATVPHQLQFPPIIDCSNESSIDAFLFLPSAVCNNDVKLALSRPLLPGDLW